MASIGVFIERAHRLKMLASTFRRAGRTFQGCLVCACRCCVCYASYRWGAFLLNFRRYPRLRMSVSHSRNSAKNVFTCFFCSPANETLCKNQVYWPSLIRMWSNPLWNTNIQLRWISHMFNVSEMPPIVKFYAAILSLPFLLLVS